MTAARAFWTVAPGRGEIRPETLRAPGPEELRIRMIASGISRGTEATVFAGRVPPSQYAVMRAPLMDGAFPFPVKYGYSAVGLTDAGRRVFVLHPHQDVFNAPAAMCVPVPDAVPTPRAVLAANMETALNILWDAAPLPGERMMVVGAGAVGLLTASLLARIPGAAVTVTDIDPGRAVLAERFGCTFAPPDGAPEEQELIVHASGSEAGLRLALDHAAFEARIVEASWFADRVPALPLGEAFHQRRLRLVSTQVGSVAPAMRGRRSHGQRLGLALSLLADPAYDSLVESVTAFDDLPARMGDLLAGGLCHVVTYGNSACSV
ncbi:zinc-dependent alcohol dehydrogenase [Limobrevibacterium gyesilva]|uniref:Zinc-binding alcohol dehydrogenase n=1 Tax=Limobrevibacterium gyesilva TaxID=2991712 RepID=A0AA42CHM1_9PROT|nr:zinc-binding alcohol dehydrogenase [Limobrevibacterium gyesilva]MCW3475127.1 zinc-binding alcohol dehydrogenase [Limobrevibacterium gyesilva]